MPTIFATFLSAFVGALLAGFAKQIFDFFKRRADKLEKTRDTLELLCVETLEEIRALTSSHCLEAEDAKKILLEGRIVALLDYLPELYLGLFQKTEQKKRDCDVLLNSLRRAATGGNFGVRGIEIDVTRMKDVEINVAKLDAYIRLERARLSPNFI